MFISHVGVGVGGLQRVRLSEYSNTQSSFETVDISPTIIGVGQATATAISASGQPLVAFVGNDGAVYFAARLSFTTWSITAVDTVHDSVDLAMHLDSACQPLSGYRKGLALRHAYLDSVLGWRRETIDSPALGIGPELDCAIDASDVLHIGYQARLQYPTTQITPVRYARGTFGSWTIETVEGQEDEGSFIALTTTAAGDPVVGFYDATLGDVQVGRRVSQNSWSDDDIAEVGNVGRFVAMPPRIVAASTADVAYFNSTNGTIVQRSGSYDSWNETFIAAVPALASLSYADSAGFGRVAYYDSAAGDVYLARLGPGGTSIVPVDQTGDVGRSCSIGVTTDGVTHIIYYDATVGRLKHARFVGGAWVYQTIATGPGVGRSCALATNLKALGVAYYDAVNADLHWARWDGSAWSTGLVDATNDVGSVCAVVIGPGDEIEMSYYDATAAAVKFASVTETGTVVALEVVDSGNVGRPNAIALDPTTDLAEIVYYDATLHQIRYAKQVPGGTGVDELTAFGAGMRIAPSPARIGGQIRVALAADARHIRRLTLFDVRGRELSTTIPARAGVSSLEIPVPPASSGIVFVRAEDDDGHVSMGRVVVLR